jgi:hypothetical protein
MNETRTQVIELHPLAPDKPDFGVPCNGCGVCCAAEPCPVAFILLFQISGRCRALLWQDDTSRYVCGLVAFPDRYVRVIPESWRERIGRFVATRIAAGKGCDSSAEVVDTHEN